MRIHFDPMTEDHARAILGWHYDEPYDFYNNATPHPELALAEMLDGSHYAVTDDTGALVGFFATGAPAQLPGGHERGIYTGRNVLDIGLGLRPDLTGRGLGLSFVEACLDFALQRFKPAAFRLAVATFNRRAIHIYERAGFQPEITFTSMTSRGETEFLLMTRHAWVYGFPARQPESSHTSSA